MSESVLERVRGVVGDVFGVAAAQITAETSQDTLPGWDSLQHLNIVLSLEKEFGIRLAPAEAEGIRSVGAMVKVVESKNAKPE